MLCESGLGPGRQALVLVKVLAVGAHVESQLAPCDELIEKCFRRFAHAPPTLHTTGHLVAELCGRPLFTLNDFSKDLVGGELAKMKIRRKAAGTILIGVVASFV